MADKKRYVSLPGLQEYDKGVKNALLNLDENKADKTHNHDAEYASTEHDHEAITTEEIRNIFKVSNYEDGDTGSY